MFNSAATGADLSRKGVKGQQSYWGGRGGADGDPEHRNILYRERGKEDGGVGGERRDEGEDKH